MNINFKDLCQKLELDESYRDKASLERLALWCREHISQDIAPEEDDVLQYEQCLQLAKDYYDAFLPVIPTDLSKPIADFDGLNAIQQASRHGYHRFIEKKEITPQQVNLPSQYGMTPLHVSATHGFLHTTKALLAKGANCNALNERGQHPIHSALFLPLISDKHTARSKKEIFKLLARQGEAQILCAPNRDGDTVLHEMAKNNTFAELIALISQQAPKLFFTPNEALVYPIHTAILNGQYDSAEALLKVKGVVSIVDGHEQTPLHYAARYADVPLLQLCIKHSNDLEQQDSESKTPLLLAAENHQFEALQCLIAHQANPLAVDYKGYTILHYAIQNEDAEMTNWIVQHLGQKLINKTDVDGHTALFYAKEHANHNLEQILQDAGADETNQLKQ